MATVIQSDTKTRVEILKVTNEYIKDIEKTIESSRRMFAKYSGDKEFSNVINLIIVQQESELKRILYVKALISATVPDLV